MKALWAVAAIFAMVAVPGWRQAGAADAKPPSHFAITEHQVAQALSTGNTQIADTEVTLLAKVVASEADAKLDLLSAEPAKGRFGGSGKSDGSLVMMGCRTPGACVPFFAVVDLPIAAPAATTGGGDRPHPAIPVPSKAKAQITIRSGAHAVLEIDSPRSQIRISVVTLESGATGARIRVATPDRHQTYWAEVMGPKLLRGSY